MEEIWKDILGYEGSYQVSNLGRVKSLARNRIGRGGSVCNVQERILRPRLNGPAGNQYYAVILYSNDDCRKTRKIHQLVAQTFIDQDYKTKGLVANHIDGNPLNNKLENLEIISQRSNSSTEKSKNRKTTSNYTGVCYHKERSKWGSRIYIEIKQYFLGYFNEEFQAHLTYEQALNIYLENGFDAFLEFRDSLRKRKKRILA